MSISEISRAGPAVAAAMMGASGTSAAPGGRQVVSSGGNASPPPAGQQAAAETTGAAVSKEVTEKAVATVEAFLQIQSRSLQFEVDEKSGVEIITVLDGETGEVIRQFPSEEIVASARYIAENIPETAVGLLLDQQG